MLEEGDWLWGVGILLFCFWDRVSLCRPGCPGAGTDPPAFLSWVLGFSTGCSRFKTLEKNVEHLGGDGSNSGEPVVKRLGWSYTENLVSIHFNWSSNSWDHCNPKEVEAGRLGIQGYPQLYSRFQTSLNCRRPWDLFLKKKAWIFFFFF